MPMKPPKVERRLWIGGALVAFAILFGGHTPRVVPGGPFVSFFGDVLPFIAAAVSILVVVGCLRSRQLWPKVACLVLSLIAVFAMKNIVVDMYEFTIRRSARGEFFGW